MLIGLTGQIGSGKTTVASILEAEGAVIIDADRIGRDVVESSDVLLQNLADEFGDQILTQTGQLRRGKLAELAFASDESKKRLNALVHPYLLDDLRGQVAQAKLVSNLIVIDAALLLDWGMDEEVDCVWVVDAPEDERLRRLKERGISNSDALARQNAQLSHAEYVSRADAVIQNGGTPEDLKAEILRLLAGLGA